MSKKIYDVNWVTSDGQDGFYVELSPEEAKAVERVLVTYEADAKISEIHVRPIEKPWLLTKSQFMEELRARMEDR